MKAFLLIGSYTLSPGFYLLPLTNLARREREQTKKRIELRLIMRSVRRGGAAWLMRFAARDCGCAPEHMIEIKRTKFTHFALSHSLCFVLCASAFVCECVRKFKCAESLCGGGGANCFVSPFSEIDVLWRFAAASAFVCAVSFFSHTRGVKNAPPQPPAKPPVRNQ